MQYLRLVCHLDVGEATQAIRQSEYIIYGVSSEISPSSTDKFSDNWSIKKKTSLATIIFYSKKAIYDDAFSFQVERQPFVREDPIIHPNCA